MQYPMPVYHLGQQGNCINRMVIKEEINTINFEEIQEFQIK